MLDEIRPSSVMQDQESAYSLDVSFYREHFPRFQVRTCPGCDSGVDNHEAFSQHRGFTFSRCGACWTIFMNPGPSEQLVESFYQQSSNYRFWADVVYPTTSAARQTRLHQPRAQWVKKGWLQWAQSDIFSVTSILELGAGTGDTLLALKEVFGAATLHGIDSNPDMQDLLNRKGISVLTYESLRSMAGQFDAIVGFEVLEHTLNPVTMLILCQELLRPNGLLFLTTPNAASLEVLLLKDDSTTLDVEHISVLTPSALHSLAGRSYLQVQEISTPGEMDLDLIKKHPAFERTVRQLATATGSSISLSASQGWVQQLGLSSHMRVIYRNGAGLRSAVS